jgi:hypothetical protein
MFSMRVAVMTQCATGPRLLAQKSLTVIKVWKNTNFTARINIPLRDSVIFKSESHSNIHSSWL